MEKCLKTSVYLNDTIYSESLEQPIDVDFTLPDYCPDISKIFKCKAVPRISSKGVNGKILTVEGSVCLTLLYADTNSKIHSFEYQYPFQKSVELSEEIGTANIKCNACLEYVHCRAVSGRKLDIHGAISIAVKIFKRKCREIVSDFETNSLELKKGTTAATVPMGYAEKYLILEDNITLGRENTSVLNVLRYEAFPCIKETKLVNEKAVVKGEMSVCVLYCDENMTINKVKTVIPFSQIIDLEGVNETCEIDTKCELSFLEIKPTAGTSGENDSLNVNCKILICCDAYCPNDIAVIFDAFSRKFKTEIKKEKVNFSKILQNISDTFTCKNILELAEPISSVLDMSCEVISKTAHCENGNIKFMGSVNFGIIALTEQNETCYFEGEIPFTQCVKSDTTSAKIEAVPQIELLSCNYTFLSDTKIEVFAELQLNAAVIENNIVSLITDIDVDDKEMLCKTGKTALTVYFSGKNENAWDIARIYNASVEEIMDLNDLASENIPEGKMLLIPML